MSTKIYGGIRFVSSDLLEVHNQLQAFRPTVEQMVRDATCLFLAVAASSRIDRAAIKGEVVDNPLGGVLHKLWDRQREVVRSGHRDPQIDYEFKIVVMPFEGRIYGILFTEQNRWRDAFMAEPFVEDFSYWNNTDCPEDTTEEEWDARGALWDAILAQDSGSRPVGCGPEYSFEPPHFFPTREDIHKAIPDRAIRIELQAENEIMEDYARGLYGEAEEAGEEPDAMMIYHKAERALRSAAGQRGKEQMQTRLANIIPEITLEMLTREAKGTQEVRGA